MKTYSLFHVPDHVLLRDLTSLVAQDRGTTAMMLAHIAEVDARRLYAPAGCSSMYLYCLRVLHISEDAAYKRIQAARTARRFPAVFAAVADGRLHLSAVVLLAPYLTPATADELLAAAAHMSKAEIALLLARRFPLPDLPTLVQSLGPAATFGQVSTAQVVARASQPDSGQTAAVTNQPAPEPVVPPDAPNSTVSMVPLAPPAPRARIAPLAPERFALQVTLDQETHDLLREAQALLGHMLPSSDVARVLNRVLKDWVEACKRRRYAATDTPRPRRSKANGRYVPAEVKRAVVRRDGGRCTFVSEDNRRCEARKCLEFDHVVPVARGGRTTADNLRQRCSAHNQYAAECTFGAGFMRGKREEARHKAAQARRAADGATPRSRNGSGAVRKDRAAPESAGAKTPLVL